MHHIEKTFRLSIFLMCCVISLYLEIIDQSSNTTQDVNKSHIQNILYVSLFELNY